MFTHVDRFLDHVTMYRLMLYCLTAILMAAAVLGLFGVIPYSPLAIIFSAIFITAVSWIVNKIFSAIFKVPTNIESAYITAFILALLITPPAVLFDRDYFVLAVSAAVIAMASKYILAIRHKHIFNPAAVSVVVTSFALGLSASWWVGTASLMPFVLIAGLLVARKITRFDLVLSFLAVNTLLMLGTQSSSFDAISTIPGLYLNTPILFFAFIMLTEPQTTPPTRRSRLLYGGLVGLLLAPFVHIGSIYIAPELALVIGNIFSYIVSPKWKLLLKLKEKNLVAENIYHFRFEAPAKFNFQPGQYLEWTLAHEKPDNRGNRRYFTIASSPTEPDVAIGIKFNTPSSSFKKALRAFESGDTIVASQLAGDFTLPEDKSQKIAFIAGGIGVTPFRSMVKYMIDRGEKRPATLFYSTRTAADIAYKDIFDEAGEKLGLKTVYTSLVDRKMIERELPDYRERLFYLSGPPSMVDSFTVILEAMSVKKNRIKKDYFPGYV